LDRGDAEKDPFPPEEDLVTADRPNSLEDLVAGQEVEAIEAEETAARHIRENLEKAEKDLGDMRDRHLRKLAEFENFKKRTEKEKADYFKYALTDLFREILPVLDNFERALGQYSAAPSDEYQQGVLLIYRQLVELLRRRGLREVATSGVFDPNIHEAVAKEVTAGAPPNTILEVLQKGYSLHDRLLRPAFVKVAVAPNDVGEKA
jgi:molecular chaperone GrpE